MKRLIFLIWLLINSPLWANTKTVVIGDSTYFNYTHTTAIDSAQLILIRGTVKDTLSLMPITGSSHKICDWEGIFNQVDSAGNYNVWIEPYSSGAIADTILGDCLVELDSVLVDGSSLAATAGAISDATLAASAINKIAAYPNYLFKCVVSGSPTTQVFQVSYISPTMIFVDNQFNGLRLVSIYSQGGGAQGQVNNIADFASADSTFTIRPGMTTSVNSGDTVLVLPQRMAVEPVVLTNHAIATDGSGYVSVGVITSGAITAAALHGEAADEMAESTYTFTSGTNRLAREEDSTAFQGAAAGVDSTLISNLIHRIVWGTAVGSGSDSSTAAQRDITSARIDSILVALGFDAGGGTDLKSVHEKMGLEWLVSDKTVYEFLDDIEDDSAVCEGSGVNICSLWVYDTGNSVTVSNIMVRANNSSGADQGHDRTNVSGISVLYLNNGSYSLVTPMNSGYIQTTRPQSFTVSGATNDTIEVTWFSPSAPEGDLCTVYNYVKDANNNPVQGVTITAAIPTNFWPIRYEGQAVKARYYTKTDGNGLWQLPVFPNGLLLTVDGDSASYYLFTDSEGVLGDQGFKVTVPTDSSTFFMVPDDEQ